MANLAPIPGGKNLLTSLLGLNKMFTRNRRVLYPKLSPPAAYTVRPSELDIGMTCSTYDTSLKRRRQIKDPNQPVFGLNPVECLKWTDWKMLRDVRRRYLYAYHFPLRNNLTCMFRNDILPTTIRVCSKILSLIQLMKMLLYPQEIAHSETASLYRQTRIRGVTWRCSLTSRGKGKFIKFRMSRIAFRNLADHNFISGAMKAIW